MRQLLLCTLLALTILHQPTRAAEPIHVGVASIDITPPVPYRMSGYFRQRLSEGTHDPLHAKAIVFRQGDIQAALVTCDLVGITRDVARRAREQAAERTAIPADHIVISATHTHTGPLYFGALRDLFHRRAVDQHGHDPYEQTDYPADLARKIADAIADAQNAAQPATLHTLTAHQDRLSFNRRFRMNDGSARFNPGKQNPNAVHTLGPIDPDLTVLMIRDAESGDPRAALTVFALHLDTVGGTEYSADYPHYLQQSLQQQFGDDFTSLFAIGAAGDINHVDTSHSRPQKGHAEAQRIGQTLGETIIASLDDLAPLREPNLAVRGTTVHAPLQQYSDEEVEQAREKMNRVDDPNVPFLDRVKARSIVEIDGYGGYTLPLRVRAIRLGPDTAIVTLPGEVFVELGLTIKHASPFDTTLVVTLADAAPGYIPTARAFAEGSYETVNSRIQSPAGETLVEAAIQLLWHLKNNPE